MKRNVILTCDQKPTRVSCKSEFFEIWLLFFVAEVMSNYLTTDGLKIFSLLPEDPWGLRPVAFATSATRLIWHWAWMYFVVPRAQPTRCVSALPQHDVWGIAKWIRNDAMLARFHSISLATRDLLRYIRHIMQWQCLLRLCTNLDWFGMHCP